MLTVVDQFSRQSPLIEPRFGFGGRDVAAALDRIISQTGAPISITVDHGTEFTSKALHEWAYRRGVKLDFTHPGKPTENGHIESFNGQRGKSFITPGVMIRHRPAQSADCAVPTLGRRHDHRPEQLRGRHLD